MNGIASFSWKKLLLKKEALAFFLVVIVAVILLFSSEHFLNSTNLDSLQTSIAPSSIIAVGMMILLITGMFDLSVGSIMGLSGVVTAIFLTMHVPVPIAILLGLLCGTLLGLVNGLLIAVAGINPLITTIGMMFIARGISEVLLVGKGREGYRNFSQAFISLGTGKFLGLYYMFWAMIVFLIVTQFYLNRFKHGRILYYIGGNPEAAALMGFSITKVRIVTFMLSGFLSAFAGIISTARYEMANRYMGQGLHMNIIISCLIGGGSLAGGQGSIIGALLGITFMTLLNNSFNLLEIQPQWQNVVIGIILILVVTSDGYLAIRKKKLMGKT
jgi:ribose transport system permease protein